MCPVLASLQACRYQVSFRHPATSLAVALPLALSASDNYRDIPANIDTQLIRAITAVRTLPVQSGSSRSVPFITHLSQSWAVHR